MIFVEVFHVLVGKCQCQCMCVYPFLGPSPERCPLKKALQNSHMNMNMDTATEMEKATDTDADVDMNTRQRRAKTRIWTWAWIRTKCDMDMVFDIDDIHVLFKREFWHACFNGKLFNAYSIFLICNATFNAHIAFRQRFNFRSFFLQEKSTDNFQSYLRCQRTTFSAFNLRDARQQATSTVDFYPLNGKNSRKLFFKRNLISCGSSL